MRGKKVLLYESEYWKKLKVLKVFYHFISNILLPNKVWCVKVKRAIKQNNKAAVHSKLLRWLDQHSREHNVRSSNSFSDAKLKLKSGQERQRNKNRLRRPLQQLVEPSIFTVVSSKSWERGARSFSYFHLFEQLAHHHSSLELFPSSWENYFNSRKSRTITNFAYKLVHF